MEYERSTHARNWIFVADSLRRCRQEAVSAAASPTKARKFASGYHAHERSVRGIPRASTSSANWSVEDQEVVLCFHSQQLETLCGPTACLGSLRTSQRVLATAITLFRRFYLSNSVTQHHPRHICAAAAFLAGKVEEDKIELGTLSHATLVIHSRVVNNPLYSCELSFVTTTEIESAERVLMEGINYELIVHHADSTLRQVANDMATRTLQPSKTSSCVTASVLVPTNFPFTAKAFGPAIADQLLKYFPEIEKLALMFTDIPFLCSPEVSGYAIAAVAFGSYDDQGRLGELMQDYLVVSYSLKSEDELIELYREINLAIGLLLSSSYAKVYISALTGSSRGECNVPASQALAIETVLLKATQLRKASQRREMANTSKSTRRRQTKRSVPAVEGFHDSRDELVRYSKLARITP